MPNQDIKPRITEKLCHAEVHLNGWQALETDQQAGANTTQVNAQREAFVMAASGAYQALLCYIANQLDVFARITVFSCEAIDEQLEQRGQRAPELQQLQILEQDSTSWLSRLLYAAGQAQRAYWQTTPQRAPEAIPMQQDKPLGLEEARDILQQLQRCQEATVSTLGEW